MKKRALIVYATMSGNTEETAELIQQELENKGIDTDKKYIGVGAIPDNERVVIGGEYDALFFGTYTWDLGYAPEEVSYFVENVDIKDVPVYSFGTGETQFGEELFCVASDKIASYYNSPAPVLKIEQSPRGWQESFVKDWVNNIIRKHLKE